ncbi:MAG: hypothetical protein C0473_02965 [Cyanobacteria bacterium DS3.002]|jgi:hypothetical protein|nr:hypothetical protein [Cyanobacteria bacterium DS3.002]MBA4049839.1 hypothetical protein [Cyanobacteria bacterium DS2.008]MBA4078634.1 hypothetical protein [Cyanobacteria bacterium PR.023]MDQ5935379.1 hypothetical protein [Cyanobacteriota bacterium erpe_2018_sw_21hr_WHONDRS-SW48-000092_B_bin.40]
MDLHLFERIFWVVWFVFVAVACSTLHWFMPEVSGWRQLQSKYPVKNPYKGAWMTFESVLIGNFPFKSCLNIGTDAEHLYLSSIFLFRWCTGKPLQIPWSAVTRIRPDGRWLVCRIEGAPADIALPARAIPVDIVHRLGVPSKGS